MAELKQDPMHPLKPEQCRGGLGPTLTASW